MASIINKLRAKKLPAKKKFLQRFDEKTIIANTKYDNMKEEIRELPELYWNQSVTHDKEDMPDLETLNFNYRPKRCFICENDIKLDYKNHRLLSQFCSPYTGQLYGRHITGLCIPMQERISNLINTSQSFGYMPKYMKDKYFLDDPLLIKHQLRSIATYRRMEEKKKKSEEMQD
ncbi:MAG: 28S ribosomal protein S18c, mitochondrial [Marteilia pararefringens]